jgi:hypothetical protein
MLPGRALLSSRGGDPDPWNEIATNVISSMRGRKVRVPSGTHGVRVSYASSPASGALLGTSRQPETVTHMYSSRRSIRPPSSIEVRTLSQESIR